MANLNLPIDDKQQLSAHIQTLKCIFNVPAWRDLHNQSVPINVCNDGPLGISSFARVSESILIGWGFFWGGLHFCSSR